MNKAFPLALGLAGVTLLAGCLQPSPGVGPGGELPVIATAADSGPIDSVALVQGEAAIVYDPDGCQNWLIDDGAEGYASRRRDPRSGLPVCNARFPPGTVVRNYELGGIADWVPSGRRVIIQGQGG